MLVLTDVQKVLLSVKPVSAAGNPAQVDGPASWTVSGDEVVKMDVSQADGLSAYEVTTGKVGVCQVKVTCDADMGDGVKEITGVLDIEVKASEAVSLGVSAGVPEDK